MEKPFQGLATFLKSPIRDYSRPFGIFGVPYDGSTSFRPGTRFAPNAIRQASMMLTDGHHPYFETLASEHVTDLGDIITSNINVQDSLDQITDTVRHHGLKHPHQKLFFMGGDHTITTGVLRAYGRWIEDLVVVHFDAHCDTWADHFGDPLGHGTWVRNVVEEGLVKAENIIQIGIRSPVDPETKRWLPNRGGTVLDTWQAHSMGGEEVANKVWALTDRGRKPVYISFDIDCLDPAYAPGTGTPEFCGLTPHFVTEMMCWMRGLNVIGMDLVEVSPPYDPTQATALTGASMLWHVMSMLSPK